MFRNKWVFLALLIGFLLSSLMLVATRGSGMRVEGLFKEASVSLQHSPGITKVMSAKTQQVPTRKLSVLFIGNSFTFYNNMPGMLVEIAKADPGNTVALDVQAVTKGGVNLDDLWRSGEGRKILQQRKWDYVVLQDNSTWAMIPEWVKRTTESTINWTSEIKAIGAKPLFVMTWPDKPDGPTYKKPEFVYMKNADNVYQIFSYETYHLAELLKATVVPVGDYWYFAVQQHPELNLYEKDSHHPSRAGSYLQALVFYRMLTGRSSEDTSFAPRGVSTEHAGTIRKIVSYDGFERKK